jgi:thiamine pyrophosphate-dependent acetolactate synthase large subunit-like protein
MIKTKVIQQICSKNKKAVIVSANGFISRDLFETHDKLSNFYMIGSMGLASSIALGVAIKNPKKKIFVFDGDGNILMNFGSLATIGFLKPKNLVHFVFDNNSHESTGGQPTISSKIKIEKIAQATNYKIFTIKTKKDLENILIKIKKLQGPIFVLIKIKNTKKISKRVEYDPEQIKLRFMKSLEEI